MASFFIVKPVDMSQSSGLMWHDVPNRGGRITISADLRNLARRRPEQRLAGRQRRRDAVSGNASTLRRSPRRTTNGSRRRC